MSTHINRDILQALLDGPESEGFRDATSAGYVLVRVDAVLGGGNVADSVATFTDSEGVQFRVAVPLPVDYKEDSGEEMVKVFPITEADELNPYTMEAPEEKPEEKATPKTKKKSSK